MSKAKRHNDGGTCCECGGAHECEACPTFDAPKVATKETTHTPGPWFAKKGDTLNPDRTWGVVVPLTREECEEIDGDAQGFDANGDGRTVVVAEVCDTSHDDGEADARLLAQAPAMLAALREVKRLRDLWRSQDDAVSIDSIAYMDGLDRIDVDAIVAAAEGGAR